MFTTLKGSAILQLTKVPKFHRTVCQATLLNASQRSFAVSNHNKSRRGKSFEKWDHLTKVADDIAAARHKRKQLQQEHKETQSLKSKTPQPPGSVLSSQSDPVTGTTTKVTVKLNAVTNLNTTQSNTSKNIFNVTPTKPLPPHTSTATPTSTASATSATQLSEEEQLAADVKANMKKFAFYVSDEETHGQDSYRPRFVELHVHLEGAVDHRLLWECYQTHMTALKATTIATASATGTATGTDILFKSFDDMVDKLCIAGGADNVLDENGDELSDVVAGSKSANELYDRMQTVCAIIGGDLAAIERAAYLFCRRQRDNLVLYSELRFSPHLLTGSAQYFQRFDLSQPLPAELRRRREEAEAAEALREEEEEDVDDDISEEETEEESDGVENVEEIEEDATDTRDLNVGEVVSSLSSRVLAGLKRDGDVVGAGVTAEEVCEAVLRGLGRGGKEFGVKVKAVVSCLRYLNAAHSHECVELAMKYRDYGLSGLSGASTGSSVRGGVVGIDLFGDCDELKYHCKEHQKPFLRARRRGICRTVHVGESLEPKALLHGIHTVVPSNRIGYAVTCKFPRHILHRVFGRETLMELCLTQNMRQLGLTEKEVAGFMVWCTNNSGTWCVNTDAPALLKGVSFQGEVRKCMERFEVREWEMIQATFAAARGSFLGEFDKNELLKELRCLWKGRVRQGRIKKGEENSVMKRNKSRGNLEVEKTSGTNVEASNFSEGFEDVSWDHEELLDSQKAVGYYFGEQRKNVNVTVTATDS